MKPSHLQRTIQIMSTSNIEIYYIHTEIKMRLDHLPNIKHLQSTGIYYVTISM